MADVRAIKLAVMAKCMGTQTHISAGRKAFDVIEQRVPDAPTRVPGNTTSNGGKGIYREDGKTARVERVRLWRSVPDCLMPRDWLAAGVEAAHGHVPAEQPRVWPKDSPLRPP